MIPMLVPTAPERESPTPGPRRNADGEGARDAFDGEIRGAERRASGKAAGKGAPVRDRLDAIETHEAEPGKPSESDAEALPEAPRAANPIVGLLAALSERAPVERPLSNASIPQDAARSARDGKPDGNGVGAILPGEIPEPVAIDPVEIELFARGPVTSPEAQDLQLGTQARLKIAHQETHFEPTMREGVLVADEAAAPPVAARAADGRQGLVRLLATPPASAGAERDDPAGVAVFGAKTGEGGRTGEADMLPLVDRALSTSGDAAFVEKPRPLDNPRARTVAAAAPFAADTGASRAIETAPAAASEPVLNTGTAVPTLSTQVAGRIVDAFSSVFSGGTSIARSEAQTSEAQLRLRAGGSVLKTLTIQLQPEHLGTLNISMSLKDGQLTLEMAANRAETARLLTQDRGALRSILEKAGFSIDDAAIAVVNREAPAVAANLGPREASDGANRDMARSGDFQPGSDRRERGGEDRNARGAAVPASSATAASPSRAGTGGRASGTVFL